MKAKSMKLRMLVTLHSIWKHSDEKHRMNSVKLNPFLKPFGLDCTNRVLSDTVRVMREFGINVQAKGEWDNKGIWIKDRPLSDDKLSAFIFAITTNPYLSEDKVEQILTDLVPLVTVYQEPLLKSYVKKEHIYDTDTSMYQKYIVICDAISSKRRIRYRIPTVKYDIETQSIAIINQWPTLFTPKSIHQKDDKLYMLGYNHSDKKTDSIDISLISDVKIAFKHKDPKAEEVIQIINNIDFDQFFKETQQVLYKGELTFKCRGQYLHELYRRFGEPYGPINKDARCRSTYTVKETEITPKMLYELSQIPNLDIRIIGPKEAVCAVQKYYEELSKKQTSPTIKA